MRNTRQEMIDFQTTKMNVDKILGLDLAAWNKRQDIKRETEV